MILNLSDSFVYFCQIRVSVESEIATMPIIKETNGNFSRMFVDRLDVRAGPRVAVGGFSSRGPPHSDQGSRLCLCFTPSGCAFSVSFQKILSTAQI